MVLVVFFLSTSAAECAQGCPLIDLGVLWLWSLKEYSCYHGHKGEGVCCDHYITINTINGVCFLCLMQQG